jgi:hypothetical protein
MNVQRIVTDEISIYTGKSNECHSCGGRNLDSGYPPAADSGMTGSANCDIVSNERGGFWGAK